MLGARVPEAAIDEDGHLRSGEHDVGRPSQLREWLYVNPVAKAKVVQPVSKAPLRLCVAGCLKAHPFAGR